MQCHYESKSVPVPVEAMAAAASYVVREYGESGYRIGLAGSIGRVAIFEVSYCDGSRFNIAADRWGNVERIPDGGTAGEVGEQLVRMARAAVTA